MGFNVVRFTDVVVVIATRKTIEQLEAKINFTLARVSIWMRDNDFTVSISKTLAMMIL